MERIDKYLSDENVATRKELREMIKHGLVTLNGVIVTDPGFKIDPDSSIICFNGNRVEKTGYVTIMLHKPAGYICAVEDRRDPTVMELIPESLQRIGLNTVGRLDKDTEGLLLLTNDGDLLHRMISPKYEVKKRYYAEYEGNFVDNAAELFETGIKLNDGTQCLPAVLEPIKPGICYVTVMEGKYHQVKRMIAACGGNVTYLKREEEGNLKLGSLPKGMWRILTEAEIDTLPKK